MTVTATVEAIDAKVPSVTLKGPEGKVVEVKIRNRKNLENVKVGDQVVITTPRRSRFRSRKQSRFSSRVKGGQGYSVVLVMDQPVSTVCIEGKISDVSKMSLDIEGRYEE